MMYFNNQIQNCRNDVMLPVCGKKRALSCITNRNNVCCDAVKPRRRVHFSEDVAVRITTNYSSSHEMIDNNNIWYTKREVAMFTKQARDYVLGFGHPSDDENTRGFERYGIERMQQKAMTRKVILLLTQQKTLTDDEKSIIAHRSSAWALEEAFVQGCMDFCEAYHPQLTHVLQAKHQDKTTIIQKEEPFHQTKRRKLNTTKQTFSHHEILSRAA